MFIKTKTIYPKHYVEVNCRYHCLCGRKFYRLNRDWFTVNPLNTKDYNESRKQILERMKKKVRDCPKCGNPVKPK